MKRTMGILIAALLLGVAATAGADDKAILKKAHEEKGAPAISGKISVEKAKGANAYTVAELYANGARLNGKTVVVRAKVVKVSPQIMGKNWIHLRDGSGEPEKGNNNLVVTSQDLPMVGDVVTAGGTLRKDKDFGSGYKYSVIMEEANVKP
ncbi:MAG: hypothetical protein HZA60_02365 [Deltaproteobacteria bacterium]|nr:hypothetical protein [Deltaproteobacteria bacterium]